MSIQDEVRKIRQIRRRKIITLLFFLFMLIAVILLCVYLILIKPNKKQDSTKVFHDAFSYLKSNIADMIEKDTEAMDAAEEVPDETMVYDDAAEAAEEAEEAETVYEDAPQAAEAAEEAETVYEDAPQAAEAAEEAETVYEDAPQAAEAAEEAGTIYEDAAEARDSLYIGTMYVTNCNEYVTLRKWASTNAPAVTLVAFGQQVDAYFYNDTFYECVYHGMRGYIKAKYLDENPSRFKDRTQENTNGVTKHINTGDNMYNDSARDLSNFDYRTVVCNGRGALLFQSSPRGSFMWNHEFWDGDQIYVNLYWRNKGYAIAYENGEYGYVDASYIAW